MHGGSIEAVSTPYRGADRRGRIRRSRRGIRRTDVLALFAALLLAGGLLPLGLGSLSAPAADHAQQALRTVWSVVFLAAGVLHLVRWRITGETRTAIRGAATICFGALTVSAGALAPLLASSVTTAALTPLTRAVAVVACLSLLTRAIYAQDVDTRARPLRTLGVTLVLAWTFVVAMVLVSAHGSGLDLPNRDWFGLEMAMAAGWFLCATAAALRARRERSTSFAWLSIALALMGVAEVCRGTAFAADARLQFVGTGVQLVVAAVVLVNAATDLAVLLSAESGLLHLLSGAVRDTERQLSADELVESARRHDARAVLASLRAASSVLDRYDETLDQDTRAQLLGSFTNELTRLEQMIELRSDATLESFALDEVVVPALRAVEGVAITSEITPTRVRGRAEELGAVVRTVVATLGRHAIDNHVDVRVARSTSGVQIVCEAIRSRDGVPAQLDAAGSDAARNLRLQVARRIMREQAGDVVVTDRWDGTTSVLLWLRPAADPAPTPQPALPTPQPTLEAPPCTTRVVRRPIRQVS
jgi:hypothetical protein